MSTTAVMPFHSLVQTPISPSPLRALVSRQYIEINLKNVFNSVCRQAAFDAISGVATKEYVGAGVSSGEKLPCLADLQNLFRHSRNLHDKMGTLRFFHNCGRAHDISGFQGGQQGDPLEMLRFCHIIHL